MKMRKASIMFIMEIICLKKNKEWVYIVNLNEYIKTWFFLDSIVWTQKWSFIHIDPFGLQGIPTEMKFLKYEYFIIPKKIQNFCLDIFYCFCCDNILKHGVSHEKRFFL